MNKTLSMVSHRNYNLSAHEGFLIVLTFKLITCFIDGFTSKMKSHSIAYLFNASEHIYWISDLDDEVHSIWDIWRCGLQKHKGNCFIFQSQVEEVGSMGFIRVAKEVCPGWGSALDIFDLARGPHDLDLKLVIGLLS